MQAANAAGHAGRGREAEQAVARTGAAGQVPDRVRELIRSLGVELPLTGNLVAPGVAHMAMNALGQTFGYNVH